MKRLQRQFETVPITEVLKKAIDIDGNKMIAKETVKEPSSGRAPKPFRRHFAGAKARGQL